MHYFISDCHLSPNHQVGTALFEKFFATLPSSTQSVYILGDLFDAWVGDDAMGEYENHIAQILRIASKQKNIQLFFMAGNRDYLIGPKFLSMANMQCLPDPYPIEINNQHILLTHGDQLCVDDRLHQGYRLIMQNTLSKKITLSLPKNFRISTAKWLRKRSQARYKNTQDKVKFYKIDEEKSLNWLKEHQTTIMIHGHIHQPEMLDLPNDCRRIVLGDWHERAKILEYSADEFKLIEI